MSRYVFKLPDLGEGTVEAEIVGWHVKPGDQVSEDDVMVEVMTEKAAVELPAPISGRVISTTGAPGDRVPVGSELIVFETASGVQDEAPSGATTDRSSGDTPAVAAAAAAAPAAPRESRSASPPSAGGGRSNGHAAVSTEERPIRVATSPAIRRKAREAGVDLTRLSGSGPHGRILRQDFEAFMSGRSAPTVLRPVNPAKERHQDRAATEEIKVIGVRRLIAQRMSESKRTIPHFAYVEELDVTELESLRRHLNTKPALRAPGLTYLPFIVSALVRVLRDFPQCNALYDTERGVIVRHHAVHVGIATQTGDGLKVPVVRDAQRLSLWELAEQMRRVTEAARTNKATREELTGSTITVTSLGKLGGIASTPIINAPEVAIIGVNRAIERPVVHGGAIAIRRMMNLSSSFDHRFVDGFDAAAMIQALKERLEHPATIFIDP
ncbi:MAG TPA: dihydrolipoamide acetyltransferase family protein [Steroidobacteraceae bacterium]|nr:dihydrolipoamide acetyltransferase family protein [Steroidobacteraceae bacterium]